MRRNEMMGAEIVRASFGSTPLADIIASYPCHCGTPDRNPERPSGGTISLAARVLAIANAFDSMVNDQPYRKGRSRDEAFAELRRCAGTQFDPELVERFISVVRPMDRVRQSPASLASREMALVVGPQIQGLVAALESQNLEELNAVSGRLRATAEKRGAQDIAAKASQLNSILDTDLDPHGIFRVANELLDLCRSTQAAILDTTEIGMVKSVR